MDMISQPFFQNVLNRMTDMTFILEVEEGAQLRYQFVNEAVYKNLGVWTKHLLGKTIDEVYQDHPEKGNLLLKKYQHVITKQESLNYRDQYVDLNGNTIFAESQIDPLFNDKGVLTHLVAVVRDITRVVQQQEEIIKKNARLLEIEQHYHSIIDNNHDAIWFANKNGDINHTNKVCFEMLGVSPDIEMSELRDLAVKALNRKERVKIRKHIMLSFKGQPQEFETFFYQKNGSRIYVLLKIVPVRIGEEIQGYYGIAIDRTEQKRLENEIIKNEKQYEFIVENSKDLIKMVSLERKVVYASPSYFNVLGYKPEELKNKKYFTDIHPEDIEVVREKFNQIIYTHKPQVMEYRHRHKNGHWVWLETIASPVFDDKGNMYQVVLESRDITEEKLEKEILEHLAYHDALTDVPNRRFFINALEKSIMEYRQNGQSGSLMYLDLDRFKQINDSMGHDVGDELLKQFTNRVKGCLRPIDTLARMGGDEFTIVLPMTDRTSAKVIAKRILRTVHKPYDINGHKITISSSIGISLFPEHGENAGKLIKLADEALYKAKQNGRNGFCIVDKPL